MTVAEPTEGGVLHRLLRRRRAPGDAGSRPAPSLPDPGKPPGNRGEWDEAALTNVDVTELVKRELGTRTRPWQK
jgi:hypothetical protein